MLKNLRKRMGREEGFTLIELMVVVMIIGILIAIAIPTFLGARKRAQDRSAQSNLRNALTAEKVYYTDAQNYVPGDAAGAVELKKIEPNLTFSTVTSPGDPKVIAVSVAKIGSIEAVVCLFVMSASGETFGLKDVAIGTTAGTYYARTTTVPLPACDAAADAAWTGKW